MLNAGLGLTVKKYVPPFGPLPQGWSHLDIGGPSRAGSAGYRAGVFAIAGGGSDIWDAADHFQYAYAIPTQDPLTVTARVTQIQNTSDWAKAGVMIRATTAPDAAYVFVMLTPGHGVSMQSRATAGAGATEQGGVAGQTAPCWVRLERSGDQFTGYWSPDGKDWSEVGSVTVAMPDNAPAGLAVSGARRLPAQRQHVRPGHGRRAGLSQRRAQPGMGRCRLVMQECFSRRTSLRIASDPADHDAGLAE